MISATRRRNISIRLSLSIAVAVTACDSQQGDTAGSASALPPVTAEVVGPQPGPDRNLPRTTNPFEDDLAAATEGRQLFRWYNCEGCHGGRAGGGMGPSLRDSKWLYGAGSQEIFNSISNGRSNGMPAWGTKIPPAQIWLLVSYIESLNTTVEPAAPPPNPSYPDAPHKE
jgi:cytochrome c oxidase cbb3-type subunit III